MVGGLEPQHQQRAAGVPGPRYSRLLRVDQPAVGRLEAGLRELAHRRRTGREAVEAHARRRPPAWARLQPDPRLGDHAQDSLGAEERSIGARSGTRSRQAPALPLPCRCDRPHRLDQVVDVRQTRCEVPARARRDPAAERGELERLREVAQGEPVRAELVLEHRPGCAGLDAGRARDGIDVEHAVERPQVD